MNWEIERHEWLKISPSLGVLPDLLVRLLGCNDSSEANRIYWELDFLLVPNQVLKPGSPEVASCLVQLLPEFANEARVWVLELLSQFAAGSVGPTAATPALVERMVSELAFVIPQAAQILQYGDETESSLCVDILEICYEHVPNQRQRIEFLFREYAMRGGVAERLIRASSVPILPLE